MAAYNQTRSSRMRSLLGSTALVVSLSAFAIPPGRALADSPILPTGGSVVVGSATISQPNSSTLNVTTGTNRTAINWQGFSIGTGGTVDIEQPGASSMTYNRVTGVDPSVIQGALRSNGQVVLANPNGIWFGKNSHVDVSSLLAATATASPAALAAYQQGGRLALDVPGLATSSVVNDGEITVADQGLAALVAPGVANRGTITANWGQVHLAGGTYVTLDFYGDGLISFAVSGTVSGGAKDVAGNRLGAVVSNSGKIAAAGGQVLLTAATAKAVVDDAINMSGVVQASAATQDGGDIVLDGGQSGTVAVSGTLDASAPQAKGGGISVTGQNIDVTQAAKLDASGVTGGKARVIAANATTVRGTILATGLGGSVETSGETLDIAGARVSTSNWLLDPTDLELTQSAQTTIGTALGNGANVTIQTTSSGVAYTSVTGSPGTQTTGSGNITVDAAASSGITWAGAATLNLNAYGAIIINSGAKIVSSGSGGIYLSSGSGVSLAAGASLVSASGIISTSDNISQGSAGSNFAGTISGAYLSLTDNYNLSFLSGAAVSATQSSLYLQAAHGITVASGARLAAVSEIYDSSNSTPTIDLAGSVTASYLAFYGSTIAIDSTASIAASGFAQFSAATAYSLPSGSAALLSTPSLEIDYNGGPIGIGTTVSGTGALSFTAGNLTALGIGSGTGISRLAFYDGATAGSITVATALTSNSINLNSHSSDVNIASALSTTGSYGTVYVTAGGNIAVSSGVAITAGSTISLNAAAATDVAGSLNASYMSVYAGTTLEIDNTARINATSLALSAGSAYSLPSGATEIVTAPSLTLSYSGGPIGIGTTVSGTGALSLTSPVLTALGIGAGTGNSALTIYDNAAMGLGSIVVSTGLTTVGNISISASSSDISITSALSTTGSYSSIYVQAGRNLTIDNGAVVSAAYQVSNNYYNSGVTDVAGSVHGSYVDLYGSTIEIDNTASITATSLSLSASAAYSLPSGSTAIVTAPNFSLFYSGGPIGIGTTVSGTGALSLTPSVLTALGFGAGTGTSALTIYDNAAVGVGSIVVGTALTTAGNLSIDSYNSDVSITSALSATGSYSSIYIQAGRNLTIANGAVVSAADQVSNNSNGITDIAGSVHGSYVDLYGSTIEIDNTASITATSLSLSASAAYSLPTSSTAIVTAPNLYLYYGSYYGGGALGIGATVSGTGALSLTASNLTALGIGSVTGVSTLSFYDYASSNAGSINVGTALTTAGILSIQSYYSNVSINSALSSTGSLGSVYVGSAGTLTLGSGASISSANVTLSAQSSFVFPSTTTQIVSGTNISIYYGGGPIGLGAATATGTGALNLSVAALAELGLTSATGAVSLTDSVYTGGGITVGGPLTFAGSLSLSSYYATTTLAGAIVAKGFYDSNNISLAADTSIDTSGGTSGITVDGTIDGAHNLTLNAGIPNGYNTDTLNLYGAIGSTTPLTGLNLTGNLPAYYNYNYYNYSSLPTTTVNGNVSIVAAETVYFSTSNPLTITGGGSLYVRGDASALGYTGITFYGTGTAINTTGPITAIYHPTDYSAPLNITAYAPNASSITTAFLVDNGPDLQRISANPSAHYLLNTNISLTQTYGAPLAGTATTPFTGIFDGQGNTISGLTISNGSGTNVGLFGKIGSGGLVENLGVVNATVLGNVSVGALAGENDGTILNSYATGTVSATTLTVSYNLGGLVGENLGTIGSSHAAVAVAGSSGAYRLGGLVGWNNGGLILNDYATGNISAIANSGAIALGGLVGNNYNGGLISLSYATGSVVGLGDSNIGGLAGENFGAQIVNSFSTASVAGGGGSSIGGLVGNNSGTIVTSYAAGNISITSGAANVGGLVGTAATGGSVTSSYWDTDTTGLLTDPDSASGSTPMSTAQLTSGMLPSGFSSSIWVASSNNLPYLVGGTAVVLPNAANSETVAGTVYLSYGGTGATGVTVDIVVDGHNVGSSTTGSSGAYTVNFAASAIPAIVGTHEVIGILGGGVSGATAEDTASLPLTGLDIYEGISLIRTTATSLSAAATIISNNLTQGLSFTGFTITAASGNTPGSITGSTGEALAIIPSATNFTLDDTINTGSGALLLSATGPGASGSRSISEYGNAAITAGVLELNGASSSFTLNNAANQIGEVIAGPVDTAGIASLDLVDAAALQIGSTQAPTLSASGSMFFTAPSISFAGTAHVTASSFSFNTNALGMPGSGGLTDTYGVTIDTQAGGGSIGLGTATGTLSLTAAELAALGSNISIGDSTSTVTVAGSIGLANTFLSVTGASITVNGAVNLTGSSGYFDAYINGTNGNFTETATASIVAPSVYIYTPNATAAVSIAGTVTSSLSLIVDIGTGGSFTEASTGSMTAANIYIDPATVTIDGALNASSSISLQTDSGGSLTLARGTAAITTSNLYINADNFLLSGTGALPTVSASSVLIEGAASSAAITVGGTGSSGLSLSPEVLSIFGTTIPVEIYGSTVSAASGYTPSTNFTLYSTSTQSETLFGTVYSGYGVTTTLGGATLQIDLDGNTTTTTATSAGAYTVTISTSTSSSNHDIVVALTGSNSGATLYDGANLPGSLNVYAGSVVLETSSTAVASAIGRLSSVEGALATNIPVTTFSSTSGIVTSANTGLVINGIGSTLSLDTALTAGNGVLTLVSANTMTQTAALAVTSLLLDGGGTFTLTNTGNQIGSVADLGTGTSLASVALADAGALTLGTLNISGALAVDDNAVSVANGATISASGGVTLDTLASGGSIGIGTGVGTLNVSAAVLSQLGPVVTIGDSGSTVVLDGAISIPTTTFTVKGASITLDGTLGLTVANATFATGIGGTLTLAGGASIVTSGAVNIDTDNLALSGTGTPSITATQGVDVNTATAGDNIGLGSGTGTLVLTEADLNALGAKVNIGDPTTKNAVVVEAGDISLSTQSLTIYGASITVNGSISLTPTNATFETVIGTGSFTEASTGTITASNIDIDPSMATVTIDGKLIASSLIILDTGTGGSLTLESGSTVDAGSGGMLSIATDSFQLSGTGTAPTISASTVNLTAGDPSAPVTLGGTGGSGLNLSPNVLNIFGSIPVTITAPTVSVANGYVPPANFTLRSTSNSTDTIFGTVYTGYGVTTTLGGATLQVVIDGHSLSATANSSGVYTVSIATSQVSTTNHDIVVVLTGGNSGAALYDGTLLPGTLNVYEGSVVLTTTSTSLATAIGNLSTAETALAAHIPVTTFSNTTGIVTSANTGLVIDGAGSSLSLDTALNSGSGVLSLVTGGMITEGTSAIIASMLQLDGNGTFSLLNTANQIDTVADVSGATVLGSAQIDDTNALTLGTLNLSGVLSVADNAISIGNGATVHASGGIFVDTLASGGSIGVGDGTGTLNLSAALLQNLGATSGLVIGDGANTIAVGGTTSFAGGVAFNGAVTLVDTTEIDSPYGVIIFDKTVNPVDNVLSLTLNAGGDIYFAGSVGTDTLRLHQLNITHANNVTVAQYTDTTGAQLLVDGFSTGGTAQNYGIQGILSVGQHSLESDGDVSIFATTVDGRIVAGASSTPGNVDLSITAGSVNNVTAQTAGGNGTIVIAASSITDLTIGSDTTRGASSATINAVNITGSNINVGTGVADITVSGAATNVKVTAGSVDFDSAKTSNVQINSPFQSTKIGGDYSGVTENNTPVTDATVQLADLTVPQNASNPKVGVASSSVSSDSSDDNSDSGSGNGKNKDKNGKNKKGQDADAKGKTAHTKTYDYANQYVDKLLSGHKTETP